MWSHVLGFLQVCSTIGSDLQCFPQSFCSPCRPPAMPLYDEAEICRCLNRIGGATLLLALSMPSPSFRLRQLSSSQGCCGISGTPRRSHRCFSAPSYSALGSAASGRVCSGSRSLLWHSTISSCLPPIHYI